MLKDEKLAALLTNEESYSFQKVEGDPTLLLENVITQEELHVGDKIQVFYLSDGKYFLSKTGEGDDLALTISKVSLSHVYFENIEIEEV